MHKRCIFYLVVDISHIAIVLAIAMAVKLSPPLLLIRGTFKCILIDIVVSRVVANPLSNPL
jgi:hypothetical protein